MIELWGQTRGQIRLPAVVVVVGETMAIDVMRQEFVLKAGDGQGTPTIRFTIQDDTPSESGGPHKLAIDPTDQFKMSVKLHGTLEHEMLFKTTYRAGDMDLTDIANSHVGVIVLPRDLHLARRGTYVWEFENWRAGAFGAGTGTVSVDGGGTALVGAGTAFLTELRSGMVLRFGGFYTVVRAVLDDEHATVDPGDWPDQVGVAFEVAEKSLCRTLAGGFVTIEGELAV